MKKILVIFLCSSLLSIFIFNTTNSNNKKVLFIGENISNISFNNKVTTFIYSKITYKELAKQIKNNDYIYSKGKKVFLNQLISNSDIIIINANNYSYNEKCKKSQRVLNFYNSNVSKDLDDLLNKLKIITSAQIYIINNKCSNSKYIKYNLKNTNFKFMDSNILKNIVISS